MEIDLQQRNGIKLISLVGELNSDTSNPAYDRVATMIQPRDRVLLDMSSVSYMSSAGIRTLLLLYRGITSNGGRVVLVGLNEYLRDTLDITGFLEFFSVHPSVDEGLQALQ
ncbi:MAG: STAS domain-containing protein [Phototrophicaceae bacterium]|jgi:anti-sigma B factor antagonist